MTRKDFIELHFHRLMGIIVDAAIEGRRGPELSIWLKTQQQVMAKILGDAYDELRPAEKLPTNGAPIQKPTLKGQTT